MNATELKDIFLSQEFKSGLEELSSYLASIMQEGPIVHLLAKCLWKQKQTFALERDNRHDLSVSGTRIEFKFNYETCGDKIAKELAKCGDNLGGILLTAATKKNDRGILPRIYKDIWEKKPNMFVWIICSRDLSKISVDALERIANWKALKSYRRTRQYKMDYRFLEIVDSFLDKFQQVRPFSVTTTEIETNGDFPSTYHFRICEFKTP